MTRAYYERLSTRDRPFLLFETPNCHMHLGGTAIFDVGPLLTPEGGIDVERIRARIASRLHLIPRYRQRLAYVPVEQYPVWVDDEHFNLTYHVRHTALPRPGNERQLKALAARIMSQQLDRTRPLWEVWIVEGLEGHRFAMITKTHHAIADGISAVDLLAVLMSLDPDETIEEAPAWTPRPAPEPRQLLRDVWVDRARAPLALASLGRRLVQAPGRVRATVAEGIAAAWGLIGAGFPLPADTPLNRPIGPHRRLDWLTLDLDEVKAVKNRLGGSVNDVALATVTGAVRRFLLGRRVDLAALDYRVVIPVSLRTVDERGEASNRVSAWLTSLPVDEADASHRYAKVRAATAHLRESRQERGADVLGQVAEMVGAAFLTFGVRLASRLAPYHLIVTNVPGPPGPLYLLGARLLAGYPLVPLFENQGLGVALFSYDGKLCWGLNADWDLVPDLHDLVVAVYASFAELRQAAERRQERRSA